MHVMALSTINGARKYATAVMSPTTWFFMADADGDLSTSIRLSGQFSEEAVERDGDPEGRQVVSIEQY